MPADANQRSQGSDRLKQVDHQEAYQGWVGIQECQKCRVDSFGYDWKKLLLGLRTVLAAGPAGCVDWMMFMRGAAALAFLAFST